MPFTHFYTQARLHPEAFTRNAFTQQQHVFTHKRFYAQTLLHTEAFTQRDAFTHRSFCMLSHTNAFTHRHGDTQMILRTEKLLHIDMFAHGVTAEVLNWQFYRSLWRSNLISRGKVAAGVVKS